MAAILAVAAFLFVPAPSPTSPRDTLLREEYSFGSFENAARLAISPQGWVYVTDEGRNTVLAFKQADESPTEIGGYGWGSGAFDRPNGLATDGLNVYVSDHGNHRIQRFDRNLNFLSVLSTRDTSYLPARFGYPSGVALSSIGDLFVLDGENSRALKFSARAQFERSFGDISSSVQKLLNPKEIRVVNERVFVGEARRILEFDYYGNYVRTIGEGVLADLQGFDIHGDGIVAVEEDSLLWFSPEGDCRTRIGVRSLLSEGPMGPLRDIAVLDNKLYVLGVKRIVVWRFVQ